MGDNEAHKSEDQDKIDHDVVFSGKLKFVNALDPARNKIGKENLKKFLSKFDYTYMNRSRPKGPDYLIIDNFAELFGLVKADLIDALTSKRLIRETFPSPQDTNIHPRHCANSLHDHSAALTRCQALLSHRCLFTD